MIPATTTTHYDQDAYERAYHGKWQTALAIDQWAHQFDRANRRVVTTSTTNDADIITGFKSCDNKL